MASVKWNDFSSGWTPSDDKVNGRKNGLLQMNNVELDKNGALQMVGGYNVIRSFYPAPATDLFSNVLKATRHDYVAMTNGQVQRDDIVLFSGGDTIKTAFGVAYDYTLICSGTKYYKV